MLNRKETLIGTKLALDKAKKNHKQEYGEDLKKFEEVIFCIYHIMALARDDESEEKCRYSEMSNLLSILQSFMLDIFLGDDWKGKDEFYSNTEDQK